MRIHTRAHMISPQVRRHLNQTQLVPLLCSRLPNCNALTWVLRVPDYVLVLTLDSVSPARLPRIIADRGLTGRNAFSHSSREFKVRVSARLGSGDGSLPGLQTIISLCPHMAESVGAQGLRFLGHYCHHRDPAVTTSSKANHLPKAPPPHTIPLGVGLQHMRLEGTQFSP